MFGYVIGVAGVILAIVSIAVSWYLWGADTKKPVWVSRRVRLVEDYHATLPELEVLYRREPVRNLSVTYIAFWNAGRQTIRRSDLNVSNSHRLSIVATHGSTMEASKILDAKVIEINNPATAPTVEIDDARTRARLDFQYLDKDNGCVLRVLHTGGPGSHITIKGEIQGVSTIRRVLPDVWDHVTRSGAPPHYSAIRTVIPLGWLIVSGTELALRLVRSRVVLLFLLIACLSAMGAFVWLDGSPLSWTIFASFAPLLILSGAVVAWIAGLSPKIRKVPAGLETVFGSDMDLQ